MKDSGFWVPAGKMARLDHREHSNTCGEIGD